MKRKLSTITGVILSAVISFGSITSYAQTDTDSIGKAESLTNGIISYKLNETQSKNIQEWIDGELTDNAGRSSEWYIFGLSRYGKYNFSAYHDALLEYLSENTVRSAVSRQKYALILALTGESDSYISETIDSTIGEQGVMSFIYGLHLLNNGYKSSVTDTDTVINELLTLQKNDGGWAVMGDTGEIDTTSMAIQSLSPHYNQREDVKIAIDRALTLLSERQLENGDYSSYGIPNPESTSQVLIALTSLGIDPLTDERFIKNGSTLLDGIEIYRNNDGSFSHEKGKESVESATVQVFYALVSYKRFCEGKGSVYIFTEEESTSVELPETKDNTEEKSDNSETVTKPTTKESNNSYKLWVSFIITGVGIAVTIILFVLKKNKKQNLIAVAIITVIAVLFVVFTDFQSPEKYYGETTVKENPVGTVTISIRCDTIVGKSDKEYIPDDAVILSDSFLIEENETVFDILVEAAKKHTIQLDYSGTADAVYVVGINYIYEFDFGDLSGWLYRVNGETASTGCDRYILSDGDNIEWLFTCEMGNDLS